MESPTRTHSWCSPAETARRTILSASPSSVRSHCQIHMPFPAIAARCDVHGAGAVTGGREVTRVAGCHGGGGVGSGGCGGTGQPASAAGAEAGGVVGSERAGGCVFDGR